MARRPSSRRLLCACAAIVLVLLGLSAGASNADVSDYSGTQLYLIGPASGVASGSYRLMTSTGTTGSPQADARPKSSVATCTVAAATCGYMSFTPGMTFGALGNSAVTAAPAIPSTCKGWVVDGSGGLQFAAGSWQFAIDVRIPAGASGTPAASIVVGMWKVDSSGAPVSGGTLIDPTAGSSDMAVNGYAFAGTTHTFSFASAPSLSAFSLASTEHLCVQAWRHQTVQSTGGGNAANTWSMLANDTLNVITHPAADGFPTMTLSATPANGSSVLAGQTVTLGATYSDPESEAGTVTMQVCPTSACSSQQATTTFNGVSSASSVTWSPSLPDGTWYWRASGTDTAGGQTWSATRSFTLDTTVPTAPALVSPNDGVTTNSLTLTGTFSDPSVSDTGKLEFQLCSDSSCSSVVTTSPLTSTLANGSNGSWTISPAPSDGPYYWEARSHDTAGNVSLWSASRAVRFDTTPPTTTIDSGPTQPASTSANASLTFHASESATFECNLDGAGWGTTCTSPQSYSSLADGSHTLQIRGTDGVGNVGTPASYAWSIDTTVPSTPTLSGPADGSLLNAVPALGGPFTDPTSGDTGVVNVRVCTSPAATGVTCSGLVQSGSSSTVVSGNTATYTPSGLGDGTYDWQVQARDTAGNQSGWSATRSFTLDTSPPDTLIGPSEPPAHSNSTIASFDFSATESGSTFKCSLDGAAYASCTSPVSYSSLSEATHTFSVEATDAAGNIDPTPGSYTWAIDMTPPDTSIGPTKPAPVEPSSSATFDLSATESSTFECSLDGSAWVACTSPKTYSGLSEASHTLTVRATDLAGNLDATPASYTWYADTSIPSAALASPAAGFATNALPQFDATFTDPNGSDSGTIEFRVCTTAASAGAACGPVVQDVVSSVVASGATATYSPGALANGLFYWQSRAQDNAGNQSAWTATRSFIYDTNLPDVPVLQSPAGAAWVSSATLTAAFNEPSFAGAGWVEFRVCPDALCLATAASGNSASVSNGSPASWQAPKLTDGYWWWQARAHDAAGNVSAWSSVWGYHLDATPPAAPTHFNGTMGPNGLTLRWNPPVDSIANFVVYVNGDSGPYLGGVTYEYNVGAFDAHDARTFSVRAVDQAGNFGAMSTVLVGVPNLVGMTLGQAETATLSRGLVLHRATSSSKVEPAIVVSQDPATPSVESQGSPVSVVLKKVPAAHAPFTVQVLPARILCAGGSMLKVHLQLSLTASVRALVVGRGGRVLVTRSLGRVHPGTAVEQVRLPRSFVLRVVFVARSADGRTGRAVVHVAGVKHGCRAAR